MDSKEPSKIHKRQNIPNIKIIKILAWIPYSSSTDRSSLVFVGTDYDGSPMYVARGHHSGDLIPGKLLSSTHRCHVPYDGHEFSLECFEVLVNNNSYTWVASSNGNVPPNAVTGGQTSSGEALYVGRATHNGLVTPGKIHPSHRCLYLPFGWKEHSYTNYEVLVRQQHNCCPPVQPPVCPPVQPPFRPPGGRPCSPKHHGHHGHHGHKHRKC